MSSALGSTKKLIAGCVLAFVGNGANAAVVISVGRTSDMVCTGGVCAPSASDAVLNVNDLQKLLKKSSVTVKTGAGAVDVDITSPVTWISAKSLTLDADHSIVVDAAVSDAGPGALTLNADGAGQGGTVSFGSSGNVMFFGDGNVLTIHNRRYKLENNLSSLAGDIARNSAGYFALAGNIDAGGQTYSAAPISTTFDGVLQGLGNTISGLAISTDQQKANVGLFAVVGSKGHINSVRISNSDVTATGEEGQVGALVGWNHGTIFQCDTTGTQVSVTHGSAIGGVVGANDGTVSRCSVDASVQDQSGRAVVGGLIGSSRGTVELSAAFGSVLGASRFPVVGGLVGDNEGVLDESFTGASVSTVRPVGHGGVSLTAGGLVGDNGGSVNNCYSTGSATAHGGETGGAVGKNSGKIFNSYSTGVPTGARAPDKPGGFVGYDSGYLVDTYWNMTTSGITNPSQGAGNRSNDPGITGLTTTQLQSGLPAGFDPMIWGENPGFNGGLPYLLANPPSN